MDKNAEIKRDSIGYWPHSKKSGCLWYRVNQPLDALKKDGVKTHAIQINTTMDDDFKSAQFYGATNVSLGKVYESFKQSGIKIVYDIDDALEWIETSNPFYFNVVKDLGSHREALQYADEVTVSTPSLIPYLKGRYQGKITVVPNCYTPSEWTYPRPQREGIRIGFAGSATHVQDLLMIVPIIEKLQKTHPITFIIMGFGNADYGSWYKDFRYSAPSQAIKDLEALDLALSKIKFEWVSYIDFDIYPSTLINMALDIGLCPLKDTPFNRCRTACKAMEYTLSGALALASDVEPYRYDTSSVLVKDNQWEEVLTFYIENTEIRKDQQKNHLKWIQDNRNIENKSHLDLLKTIYIV